MAFWISKLVPHRLKHLRHFSIPYIPGPGNFDVDILTEALAKLKQHGTIKDLEIVADEYDWWFANVFAGDTFINLIRASIDKYPSMDELAEVVNKADKITFRGQCPDIEKYIRARTRHKIV